ncbi:unnamed protein product [Mytilus coruscus]|uniref:Uncharacterized protein n=1 Tax=Mytilus coruscus TaxID=42192 RepID=A0A6J8CYX5_MYTCO|nr:unnamed protein product [Mytilus coruscus]
MSASIRKRQRRENSDDSEDEWTGESSSSSQTFIPHDTSEWTDNTLHKKRFGSNHNKNLMTCNNFFEILLEHVEKLQVPLNSRAYALNSYKASFLTILESFCKMCQLFGSNVYMERRSKIQGQEVNSKPDLVFEIDNSPFQTAHKLENFSGASTLCVAEVKKNNHSKIHDKRRETRSSETTSDNSYVDKDLRETDAITKEPLLPYEINGSANHAGQLLLETKHSLFLFSKVSIGVMFTETKMYGILKAEDRRELINALLRLSCCADAIKLTKT